MPGTFAYTVATNKIVVTDGTSGAPATFNDMYTADQAGTGTILNVAENGAAAVTLDYQIRPTHSKALIIKCIVTLKTAEADYIFITGTDAWDAAQTESLDVTAGNGTYTTTKRFKTITNLDCSDNAAGGGTVWADGKIAVTQDIWGVVWEIVADAEYKIDCNVDFGDGVTATYFTSKNELVYFADDIDILVTANATLKLGESNGDYSRNGSMWSLHLSSTPKTISNTNGTIILYASFLKFRSNVLVRSYANCTINKSQIDMSYDIFGGDIISWSFRDGNINLESFYICNTGSLAFSVSPISANNIHIHDTKYGLEFDTGNVTVSKLLITDASTEECRGYLTDSIITDPVIIPTLIGMYDSGDSLTVRYTTNIHVADEDGNDLAGVTVACVDKDDTAVFSVVTDANGDIAEQTINYKKWAGTDETLTEYSPHKFTLTYGSETQDIEAITVDHPIVWHLEFPSYTTLGTQVAAIYNKLPTNYIMGSSNVNDQDTVIHTGTVPDDNSTANSINLAASASATNDIYNENLVIIISGTGSGQARLITDYFGGLKAAAIRNSWVITPDHTSVYRIYPFSGILYANTGVCNGGAADSITLRTPAPATADLYNGHTIYISGGTGVGQARLITDYSAGLVATISPNWDITPVVNDSVYIVLPIGIGNVYADVTAIKTVTDVIPNAGALTDIDTGVNNIETAVITNAAGTDIAADIIALQTDVTTIDGKADVIQERTDNLPDDPADQSEVETAITAAQTAIVDEVDANEAKIDIIDTNVDTILTLEGTVVNVYSATGTAKKKITGGMAQGYVEED